MKVGGGGMVFLYVSASMCGKRDIPVVVVVAGMAVLAEVVGLVVVGMEVVAGILPLQSSVAEHPNTTELLLVLMEYEDCCQWLAW